MSSASCVWHLKKELILKANFMIRGQFLKIESGSNIKITATSMNNFFALVFTAFQDLPTLTHF